MQVPHLNATYTCRLSPPKCKAKFEPFAQSMQAGNTYVMANHVGRKILTKFKFHYNTR